MAKKKAVLIGINKYADGPLRFCVGDATAMRGWLQDSAYGFDCTLLTDEQATTREVKLAIESTLSDAEDVALIYFAGHGAVTDYGTFLVTFDGVDRADDGLDFALLVRMIQSVSKPTCSTLIILDCCHAGALRLGDNAAVAIRDDDLSRYVHEFSDRRALLAACKDTQLSEEDDTLSHGVFTDSLLNGLAGDAVTEHGEVTVHSLYDSVARSFEPLQDQLPVFRADLSGRIVLGDGLMTHAKKREANELEEIERQADNELSAIHSYMATAVVDRAKWHSEGYRSACKHIAPVSEWFEKRRVQFSSLSTRPRFLSSYHELRAKIRQLSNIEPNLQAEFGLITKLIGAGSFGSVWLVDSGGTQKTAVKVFHGNDLGIHEKIVRFRQGFKAMRKLDHPRIVQVSKLYECPLAFDMNFVEGANFRDWNGTLDDPIEILEILLKVADTLRHAHSREVVHRDVKPENIIMSWDAAAEKWEPFLTDFDLAWFSTASIQTQEAIGTVFYAAPEQLAKPGTAGARARVVDMFSFGQVCFFALTRSNPTPLGLADNSRALADRIKDWPSAFPVQLMTELYEACTSTVPSARPKSMEVVVESIYSIIAALREGGRDRQLTWPEFVNEVRFAVAGPSHDSGGEFLSPAGQTEVSLSLRGTDLAVNFVVKRHPLVDNTADFSSARAIVNGRIDVMLRQYNGIKRKSGTQNPYEVSLFIPAIDLKFKQVNLVRRIIVSALDVLERG